MIWLAKPYFFVQMITRQYFYIKIYLNLNLQLIHLFSQSPGVLDSTTNFVEHADVVAQRLERFTSVFGPERVMAGTDCGFGTFAGFGAVDPEIAWAKLGVLRQGACR